MASMRDVKKGHWYSAKWGSERHPEYTRVSNAETHISPLLLSIRSDHHHRRRLPPGGGWTSP